MQIKHRITDEIIFDGPTSDLHGADLQYAGLRGAKLQDADLRYAKLQYADLRYAKLQYADLQYADLRGANLRSANLQGADLLSAYLQGSNLRSANLQGANLDFSAWPLWCGSFYVKIDRNQFAQLVYHLCRVNCPEMEDTQKILHKIANQWPGIEKHNMPKLGE